MSFLSSLFKKDRVKEISSHDSNRIVASNMSSKKGYPSDRGLYPFEIMMLIQAPTIKVNETHFPDYYRTDFGVGFPSEVLKSLQKAGYLRISSAAESLSSLKLTDLKNIAKDFDLKTSGKKADLCAMLSQEVPESSLGKYVSERHWTLTEAGEQEVRDNDYLLYLSGSHPYSLKSAGITMLKLNELHHNAPNMPVRDLIWGELNRLNILKYKECSKTGKFFDFVYLQETMSLFVEEEGRYIDALQLYARHLFYLINFHAGVSALQSLSLSISLNDTIEAFYGDAKLYPGSAQIFQRLIAECKLDSEGVKSFLLGTFSKETDTGIFTPKELTAFLLFELSGDEESAKKLCAKAIKNAKKFIRR